ncbi:hypothetical protein [Amycolatopsis sp. FDAARGOS 1241]|uniref:hypothetical protein n=1 Tax=Amycolatopsis sp. FDAARGOS 1241 TaxID=2778070 RepID=UPI0019509AB3|nr:hypothetical protein [Amycolatopsis sp. FDAARGOS 1241]QRP47427.1 hypothetical protein I6J71_05520 [Amycolatopsis sp. FDAARGOS 1241]
MADTTKYRAADVAAWLTEHAHAAPGPARRAGRVVADAWNARELYASATLPALADCLAASGCLVSELESVADRLARCCGAHLPDIPAWDPNPNWRKEISG